MSRTDRDPRADAIGEYWNALLLGMPGAPAGELDPAFIETIDRLRALDDACPPDPSFVTELEQAIMGTSDASTWLEATILFPRLAVTPNGHGGALPLAQPRPHLDPRRQWLGSFATAALVLLTLIGSFIAFRGPLHFVNHEQQPAIIPAIDGTPEATLPPGVTEDTVLFQQVLDEIPDGADWVGFERTTLGSGASMAQGTSSDGGVGPYLYRVEDGSVIGRADSPFEVKRAGNAAPAKVAGDTDVVLQTGDVAFVPPGVASHFRNDNQAPATILDTGVSTTGVGSRIANGVEVPGWSKGNVLAFAAPIDAWPVAPPPAPAELAVHRLALDPGASLPDEPATGLKLVGVESGTLTINWAKRSDPTVQTGTHEVDASNWMDINNANYFAKELRNNGSQPLELLIMTVNPLEPGAEQMAIEAPQEPANLPKDTILLQGTFDEVPSDASWAGLERATLQPGAIRPLGKHENEGEGPMLYRVESGELTITADGPVTVTRAGEKTSTTIPPGTDVVLRADDQGFTPSGVTSRWHNEGRTPVVVLDAAVTTYGAGPGSGGQDPNDVDLVELIEQWPINAPATPVTMAVHQQTLAPRDRIVPSHYRGLAGFYVEGGPIHVIDDDRSGSQPQTFDVPAGNGRVFGGSGYTSVPTSWTLENAGGDPVSLFFLTITDANPLEGTPSG
jgi:mannose-6-phosphate isomerase-like protein (cupin superfamily)